MKTNASKEKQIAQNQSYDWMKVLLPIAPPPCIFRLLGKVLDRSATLAGTADWSSTPSGCRSKSRSPAANWSAASLRSTARTPSPLPSFAQMCWGVLGTTANWSDGPCIDAIVLEASIEKTKKTRETSPANNPVPVTSNSSSSRLSRRRQNDRLVQGRPATKENAIFCLLNLNSQRLLDIDFSNRIHYCTICDNLVHSICLVDGVPVQIFTGICTSFPGSACLPYFNCPCSTAASWCLSQPCILDSWSQSFLPKEWITLNYFTCIAKRTEVVGFCRCFGYDCVNIDEGSSGIRFILQ